MKLEILGCAGGIGGRERFTTCLLVDHDILLDAGTGLSRLSLDRLLGIDHVFITHAHLDHVAGLALLVDAVQGKRAAPVTVHANEQVIGALKKHLFNWVLWPDFATIPDPAHPILQWQPLEAGTPVELNGRTLCAYPVNHVRGASAYTVRHGADGFMFTGDMASTPALWAALAREAPLSKVIVDCSFTNADSRIAELSMHFCPRSLLADIAAVAPSVEFLIYHLKPGHEDRIMQELAQAGGPHRFTALACGDVFHFLDGTVHCRRAKSEDHPDPYDIALRLEKLTDLSVELTTNHDTPLLLEKILKAAKNITHADGGTLYRISADRKSLGFHISINDTLGLYQGGSSGHPVEMPDIPLLNPDGSKNMSAVAAYAANTGQAVNIQDVYRADLFNFSGMRRFDRQFDYHSQSFLTVPMLDHESEVIGVLQLINAKAPETGETCPFTDTDQRFIEALASQAAMAVTTQQLIARMEDLFVSFVKLINIGIDEKSPHTGRHCEQVPILTMMLAEATHAIDSGPMAGFRMDEKDRKQLWLAGLLHDCGKITTPVHVVEKATKLETIFDRIHLIDTRFEVLRRDAEIRALRQQCAAGGDARKIADIQQALKQELACLDDDRAFLRRANIGGESMAPEDQERVAAVATHRWTGPDGVERNLLDEDEAANLAIRAGTLNPGEREIINNHISVTIRMLESLPWPKHLQQVPEYAGGHHERMDGKGYPRGLRGEQMSVQARMMAIADIFEALTAKDRPYKKGKSLSESLRILGGFRLRDHIDPDLFDVFIRRKVYLDYARRFMDPAQIDEVDESKIPGYVP